LPLLRRPGLPALARAGMFAVSAQAGRFSEQ